MPKKKRRQHHVWKHHLGAWATDGKLWCRQDGRSFRSSPSNLAVESEYYRLRQLDEHDKKAIRWLCVEGRSPFHTALSEDALGFLEHPHNIMAGLREAVPAANNLLPIDAVEVNYIEDFFAMIEAHMCPILDKLRCRDLSPAGSPGEAPWLAFFLSSQYFRTKSMEHRFLSALNEGPRPEFDCDWNRVWNAMRVILACQVGASIHAKLDSASWRIMEAPDEIELITSDQPLFNLKSNVKGSDGFAKDFSLYFPITPEFAILCDLSSSSPGVEIELLPQGNAQYLNTRMAHESFRQVFSRRRDELDHL